MNITAKTLNKLIEDTVTEKGSNPMIIFLGFKTYAALMEDDHFINNLSTHEKDLSKIKYKKIKVKITHDKYQFEVKSND